MKTPTPPTRFQPTLRHYHRHQADDPSSWDTWVGIRSSPGRAKWWRRAGAAVVALAFAGVIAAVIEQMR